MMEFISILLSSLLFIGSPVGVVLDQVAENAIRSRLAGVEDMDVRVDNASAIQLLQGKVDRLQVGARGVYPVPDLRIAIADLETDPIDLDIGSLRQGRVVLDAPLQGAVHLVITPEDLNYFLASPEFTQRLDNIRINLGNAAQSREVQRYRLTNPRASFLANNRLRLELDIIDQVLEETLKIEGETGFTVDNGHRLVLNSPQLLVDGSAAPSQLLDAFLANLGDQLSLRQLETAGITARVLEFSVAPDRLDLAVWVQVDPAFTRSGD
jgi:hypothetical protein